MIIKNDNLKYNQSYICNNFFTLLEGSICSAIIFILCSFIVPAFKESLQKSEQFRCSQHLRKLGYATQIYSEDYYNLLPHEDSGSSGKEPIGSAWFQVLGLNPHEYGVTPNPIAYNLKMNSRLEDYQGSPSFRSLRHIPQPDLTPYLFDGKADGGYRLKPSGIFKSVSPRHFERANILLLDFSTKEYEREIEEWQIPGNLSWNPDVSIEDQAY